jgi:hypothetical protein
MSIYGFFSFSDSVRTVASMGLGELSVRAQVLLSRAASAWLRLAE